MRDGSKKRYEMGQGEDEELLEGVEHTGFWSWVATLNHKSLDRLDAQSSAKEMCTKVAIPPRGSSKRFKSDMGDSGMETRWDVRGCACGFGLGKRVQEEVGA